MENKKITGIVFIALSVLMISFGSSKLINNRIFNGEIEITKDEIKEVNKYLKNKYNIKSSKTVVFEEYYETTDGNIVSAPPKEENYITNRIYLVKSKDDEFYVKKEVNDKETLYDNYVNVKLNKKFAKYLTKKYKDLNIKNLEVKEYDNSKFLLQNNSSLYSKELLDSTNKEYIVYLQNKELELSFELKEELNSKNIKDEVNKIIDVINTEKEININSLKFIYKNNTYIEYYRNIINIYSDDKNIYDKFIVLDKDMINNDSIYIDDFIKLDNSIFNF